MPTTITVDGATVAKRLVDGRGIPTEFGFRCGYIHAWREEPPRDQLFPEPNLAHVTVSWRDGCYHIVSVTRDGIRVWRTAKTRSAALVLHRKRVKQLTRRP
jgi:hypothetical protein